MPEPVVPAPTETPSQNPTTTPPNPSGTDAPPQPGASGKPAETAPTPQKSQMFAEHARLESRQRAKERDLNRQRDEIRKQSALVKEAAELRALAASDPVEFLKRSGRNADELAEMIVKRAQPPTPEELISHARKEADGVRQELRQLKQSLTQEKEQAVSNQDKANTRQFVEQTVEYISESTHADRWELINAKGPEAKVRVAEMVLDHYRRFGKELDIDVAADKIEAQLEKEARAYLNAKKLKAPTGKPTVGGEPKSLSNGMTAAQGSEAPSAPVSDEDRLARAMSIAKDHFNHKD